MAVALSARRSRLLLAALVFGHLLVISGQVDGGQGATLLQTLVFGALSPFQGLAAATVRFGGDAWSGYLDLRGVREENRRLLERVDALELLLQQKQDRVREADRLEALLGLRQQLELDSLGARVVARQGLPWFRSVVVNQGEQAGVARNDAAVAPTGVVGRVVAVGPRAARVQLLLDRDCAVGALIERSRVSGLVQGQIGLGEAGTADLVMKYVPALGDVAAGDTVVTSGLDGIYPKGLVLGHVTSVGAPSGLFRDVVVAPAVAFDRLEEVLLIRAAPPDRELTKSVR